MTLDGGIIYFTSAATIMQFSRTSKAITVWTGLKKEGKREWKGIWGENTKEIFLVKFQQNISQWSNIRSKLHFKHFVIF
jgi:hypothetical protein